MDKTVSEGEYWFPPPNVAAHPRPRDSMQLCIRVIFLLLFFPSFSNIWVIFHKFMRLLCAHWQKKNLPAWNSYRSPTAVFRNHQSGPVYLCCSETPFFPFYGPSGQSMSYQTCVAPGEILTLCLHLGNTSWASRRDGNGEKLGANRAGVEPAPDRRGTVCWLFSCSFTYLHLVPTLSLSFWDSGRESVCPLGIKWPRRGKGGFSMHKNFLRVVTEAAKPSRDWE